MNYQIVKRIMDIVITIILAILFLPVWILLPILIKIYSGDPIIYRHKRVGKDGKEFWLYKFRTMIPEADEVLFKRDKKLLKKFKESDWKLRDDPRITKFGRLIRNLTFDEFPQLYNVLRGEMGIIGPRAYVTQELKEQTKKYPETRKLIKKVLSVKPGVTGVWQTSGRNVISFKKRIKMDSDYVSNLCFWNDLKIILKTPRAMISKW